MPNLALVIHDNLLRFQRKRRLTALQRGISAEEAGERLNFLEESVLQFLAGGEDKNVFELATLISVERSWMSRVVSHLEELEFVSSFTPDSDKRSKRIEITKLGREALKRLDKTVSAVLAESVAVLTARERDSLAKLLRKLADGLGAASPADRTEADAIHQQLGRLSRSLGVFGENVIGSGLSITQLHVFDLLNERRGGAPNVNELVRLLPFDQSTVSRTVGNLKKKSYLSTQRSAHDGRSISIQLSVQGTKKLQEYRELARRRFEEGLRHFDERERTQLSTLLEKLCSEMPTNPKEAAVRGAEIVPVGMRETRAELRSFIERHRIDPALAPFDDLSRVFALRQQGEICAIAGTVNHRGKARSLHLVTGSDELEPKQIFALVKEALEIQS